MTLLFLHKSGLAALRKNDRVSKSLLAKIALDGITPKQRLARLCISTSDSPWEWGNYPINISKLPAHALELLNKDSDLLKDRLLLGLELRFQWAHFGQYGIELGAVFAGELALQ